MRLVEIIAELDHPGRWMAHCHIFEHAQLGMMREIVVEPAPVATPWRSRPEVDGARPLLQPDG